MLILETVIPPLPAWPILIANAAIYGIWGGIALSWLGSVLGAVVTFWIARSYGRSFVEKRLKADHLETIDSISREKGFLILLVARIFPLTALDILSFLAGLSSISFSRFLLATALGLIPGVATYTLFAHDLLVTRAVTTRMSLIIGGAFPAYALYHLQRRRTLRKSSLRIRRVLEGTCPSVEELVGRCQRTTHGGVENGEKRRSATVYGT